MLRGLTVGAGLLAMCVVGCEPAPKPPAQQGNAAMHADKHADAGQHVHVAPHGGALVELGEHFANLELVLDAAAGEMTVYVLDAHAENAVRVEQPQMQLEWWSPTEKTAAGGKSQLTEKPRKYRLALRAAANALSGETAGDSSEFRGQDDALRGTQRLEGVILEVVVKGQTFENVPVRCPSANVADGHGAAHEEHADEH